MRKIGWMIALFLMFNSMSHAQNVTITSVTTVPAVLTDTQDVRVVASTMFSAGGCPLVNALQYTSNDTAAIIAYYQVGMLSVICNSTDTFELGILPCSFHTLYFEAIVNGGASTDQGFFPLNIGCTTVGLPEINAADDLIIFPNPVTNDFSIQMPDKNNSILKIAIYNMEGVKVYEDYGITSNQELKKVDTTMLAKGIYFVKAETGHGVSIRKLVKE